MFDHCEIINAICPFCGIAEGKHFCGTMRSGCTDIDYMIKNEIGCPKITGKYGKLIKHKKKVVNDGDLFKGDL